MVDRIDILSIPYKLTLSPRDDKLTIHPSNTYIKYSKGTFERYKEFILEHIRNKKLCNGIRMSYVEDSFHMCDFVVTLIKYEFPYEIVGFACCMLREDAIHIDLLCGYSKYKHVGNVIVSAIKRLGDDIVGGGIRLPLVPPRSKRQGALNRLFENFISWIPQTVPVADPYDIGLHKLTTNSTNDAEGFYYKQGFVNNTTRKASSNSKPMKYTRRNARMNRRRR